MDISDWLIKAKIFRADTHVYWHGYSCVYNKDEERFNESLLFENYVCSFEVFDDLINRCIIRKVEIIDNPNKSIQLLLIQIGKEYKNHYLIQKGK